MSQKNIVILRRLTDETGKKNSIMIGMTTTREPIRGIMAKQIMKIDNMFTFQPIAISAEIFFRLRTFKGTDIALLTQQATLLFIN